MELPQNPVGEFEALHASLESREDPDGVLPYFDMTAVTDAVFFVRFSDGTVQEFEGELVSSTTVEGGSRAVCRYVPVDGDFPDVEAGVKGYVRVTNPAGSVDSDPFPINVIPRF